MNSKQLITKLKQQYSALAQEVFNHDTQLPASQQKLLQNIERFNEELFVQEGAKLSPCVEQLRHDIQQLEKLLNHKAHNQAIELHCERIQQRFSAIKRAMTTTQIDIKSVKQQQVSKRARIKKYQEKNHQNAGFNWIASNVMQSSHQLYDELNKHLNWAKKIEYKIQQLQYQLESCHSAEKIAKQNEILLMHRRLGKCRQAISYIEDRIQVFERPYQSHNR
ncbi:primosomal replication protein [Shewanella gelidii]|uniref:Primosomal protein N n=1 Tax=Shewanella gelidii TaxID=1642821 RepID=A0A917N7M1_9GAMM|nr:primosomal replication protein [Shewanella gelidii]MCL1097463.1 primosomal replication protein [Shewanella gelidii]GGI75421.1 primosomal protein N' [Shewanella gelidii]